jgi:glycosyltransferase involved in cell wall biosynthesis
LRVLHVLSSTQRRGAETFASDLVRELARDSSQYVAAINSNEEPSVSFDAPIAPLYGRNGFRTPGVRMERGAVKRLSELISSWGPSVVQAHGGEALKYSIAAAHSRGVPVFYRRIGSSPQWGTANPRRIVYGHLMRRARRVIAVAERVRNETIKVFRLSPGRVVAIPNAVDSQRVAPSSSRRQIRRSLGLAANTQVILWAGALSPEKDPFGGLDIAQRVLQEVRTAELVIAGDGPLRDHLVAAVDKSSLAPRIHLLGSRDDIGDLLVASDALLLSSRSEGMPGVVIEAGMAGVPVVAYSLGGVPEVVVDGVTGLLAPASSVGRLGDHLVSLLRDTALHSSMSAAARTHCRAKFDIAEVAPRYLELYRSCGAEG